MRSYMRSYSDETSPSTTLLMIPKYELRDAEGLNWRNSKTLVLFKTPVWNLRSMPVLVVRALCITSMSQAWCPVTRHLNDYDHNIHRGGLETRSHSPSSKASQTVALVKPRARSWIAMLWAFLGSRISVRFFGVLAEKLDDLFTTSLSESDLVVTPNRFSIISSSSLYAEDWSIESSRLHNMQFNSESNQQSPHVC